MVLSTQLCFRISVFLVVLCKLFLGVHFALFVVASAGRMGEVMLSL